MENNRDNTQQQNNEQPSINKGEQKVGRAGQEDTHDISHVDRQEGTMNNGMLGGNFASDEKENSNDAHQNK